MGWAISTLCSKRQQRDLPLQSTGVVSYQGLLRGPEPASVSRLSISEGGGEGPRAGSGWGGNSRQTGRWAYGHLRCPRGSGGGMMEWATGCCGQWLQ